MPKIDVYALPEKVWVKQEFEFPIPDTDQKVTITLRQLSALDVVNVDSKAVEVEELLRGLLVDGQAPSLQGDTCKAIAVVIAAQQGGPDDRYTAEEIATLLCRYDPLVPKMLEAVEWCFQGVNDGPPA